MDQKTVQKLSKAIDALVRAEVTWERERFKGLSELCTADRRVKTARKAVSRILDREFDPVLHEKVVKATRRAFVDASVSAEGFGPVAEPTYRTEPAPTIVEDAYGRTTWSDSGERA